MRIIVSPSGVHADPIERPPLPRAEADQLKALWMHRHLGGSMTIAEIRRTAGLPPILIDAPKGHPTMERIKKFLDGKKTYIAAIGLVGLAAFQASQGQIEQAVQSGLAALTAFGLRSAVAKGY